MAASKPFWGIPNLPAILGALHRYDVSIYSQGHNWIVLIVFLGIKSCVFGSRRKKKALWSSRAQTIRPLPPPSEPPQRPLRQTRESAISSPSSTLPLGRGGCRKKERLLGLLLRAATVLTVRGHCTSFPSSDLWAGLHRSASRKDVQLSLITFMNISIENNQINR
jgi:hypothetical protein